MKHFFTLIILLISTQLSFSQFTSQLTESQRKEISAKALQLSSYVTKLKNTEMKRTQKYLLDSCIRKHNNLTSGSFDNYKSMFEYDIMGRSTEGNELFQPNTQIWQQSEEFNKISLSYPNENTISILFFNGVQNLSYKVDYIYDNSNTLIQLLSYDYNDLNGSWFNYFVEELNYNGNQLISNFGYQRNSINTSILELKSKRINTYESGNLTNSSWYSVINSNESLVRSFDFSYNDSNLIEMYQELEFTSNGQVLVRNKQFFEYNAENKIQKMYPPQPENSLDTIYLTSFSYDEWGNLVKVQKSNNYLYNNYIINYYYDMTINSNETILPYFNLYKNLYAMETYTGSYFYDFEFAFSIDYLDIFPIQNSNKLDSAIATYDVLNNTIEEFHEEKFYYYYNQKDVGFDEISKQNLKVYPNPTNDFLNIENASSFKEFLIYNNLGALENNEILKGEKIDVTKLKPGVYYLKLIDKENIGNFSKFIVK